jgi:hypothetical protein
MDQIILRTADGNACSFWWDTAKNEVARKSAGRAIHDKVLMMKIFKPGDRDSQPHFMVERHFSDGSKKLFNGETKGPNGQMLRGPWREIMADQLKAWEMQTGDAVVIRKSAASFNLVQPPNRNYFDVLRNKLKWGR